MSTLSIGGTIMNKQQYRAEYITKDALDKASKEGGEYWPDYIEYATVIGSKLKDVIKKACSLNYPSDGECYFVALEEYNEKYQRWEDVETFDYEGNSL